MCTPGVSPNALAPSLIGTLNRTITILQVHVRVLALTCCLLVTRHHQKNGVLKSIETFAHVLGI